jgi:hypothetical protein
MTAPPPGATVRFDWRRYLTLAERLAQNTADEAALRSAISRAYYAVFGLARRRLRDHGCWPAGRDPHLRVWATYRDAGDQDCQYIGNRGFNLLDQRRRADYEDWLGQNLAQETARALDVARKILTLLDDLDPDETCCPPATPPAPSGSP